MNTQQYAKHVLGLMRILMGWVFLWPFLDKMFGLGFATAPEAAWIRGGSPTSGFLLHGTSGPFQGFFQSLSGSVLVDWLFMVGLLLIGLALVLGVGVRIAAISGMTMLILMFLAASLPPEHNPLIDEHIVYAGWLAYLGLTESGTVFGFGTVWRALPLVKRYPILE